MRKPIIRAIRAQESSMQSNSPVGKVIEKETYIMENHLTEMQLNDIFLRSKVHKKVLNSGFQRIPAISSMDLKLGRVNELLKEAGITRKMPSEFKFTPHSNREMNKYLYYQISRLDRYRREGQGRKFWFLAWSLMKSSTAFKVSAFHRIFPQWYKNMPMKYVFAILNKVEKIFKKNLDDLEYKRVYIPKANGKLRPLGVPKHAWRVALHMHASFLTLFLTDKISPHQHAYQNRKGTLTAWGDVLRKMHKYKFIYEIDLKNCFNEINSAWVSEKLRELGVPPRYYYLLENLNRNVPVFAAKDEIDESVLRDRDQMHKLSKASMPLRETSIFDTYNEMTKEDQLVVQQMALEEGMSLEEFIQLQWALLDEHTPTSIGNSHRGLPQGSALSPILTILVLDEFTKQAESSVFYADDGLFFGNKEFIIKGDPDKGIILAPEKCKWVKFDGTWISPLKFLGAKWENNKFSGHTRKGSRIDVSGNLSKILRFLVTIAPQYASLDGIFNKTSIGGNVLSKVYNDSWETKFHESKLTFEGIKNSWLKLRSKRDNYVTTSSEACQALGQIIRTRRVPFLKPANIRKNTVSNSTKPPKYIFWRRLKK